MKQARFVYFVKIIVATCYYLLVTLPLIVSAAQVTLQWDSNDPEPDGYRLYQRQSGQAYNYATANWTGTDAACTVSDLQDGVTYYFVVRAFVGTDESGDSNEVSYTPGSAISEPETTPEPEPSPSPEPTPTPSPELTPTPEPESTPTPEPAPEPTPEPGNTSPNQPQLSLPDNGAVDVALTTALITMPYADADNDAHVQTRYQVSLTDDFNMLIFDNSFAQHLTSLTLGELILEPETTYYWRVRFYDERDGQSDWSAPYSFTTIDFSTAGDLDGDGVLDAQEPTSDVDLNRDGVADSSQPNMQAVTTSETSNPHVAVASFTNGAHMGGVHALDIVQIPPFDNEPENLSSVISFKLYLEEGVDTASVKIYFTNPAPQDAIWYKYDLEDGWTPYPHAELSADGLSVTLIVEDGGMGDQDGVVNGIIVDPAALGYSEQGADRSNDSSEDSLDSSEPESSGCFITSLRLINS